MLCVCPFVDHRYMLLVEGIFGEERRVIPMVLRMNSAEHDRIFRTDIDHCVFYYFLTRTNDDVVEIALVAVPNNGIIVISHTFPFALPFIQAASGRVEGRMNGVS